MTLFHSRWTRALVSVTTIATMLSGMIPILPARSARADGPAAAINGQGDNYGTGGPPSLGASGPQGQPSTGLASVNLSTGAATASFDFQLETARGQAQPKLGLQYSSSGGVGFAGLGWTLNLPAIERRGASGMPQFDSDVLGASSPLSDKYLFAGAPLVPICTISASGGCTGMVRGEQVPNGYAGWTYFRSEVDNGMRFFLEPGGQTWIVETKQGVSFEFGDPGASVVGGATPIERMHDPDATLTGVTVSSGEVFRWNLAQQWDLNGNSVYYRWSRLQVAPNGGVSAAQNQGREYLTDIYDTHSTESEAPTTASFAHHVRLTWATGGIPYDSLDDLRTTILSQSPSWATPPSFALHRVDVTSSPWSGGTRELVRRYWLNYQPNANTTQTSLANIVIEGTCKQWAEDAGGSLPESTGCPTLPGPAMTYTPTQASDNPTSTEFGDYSGAGLVADSNGDAIPELFSSTTAFNLSFNSKYDQESYVLSVASPPCAGCQATLTDVMGGFESLYGDAPELVLGNWWNDGQLNWLAIDFAPGGAHYEVYSNSGGAAAGTTNGDNIPATFVGMSETPVIQPSPYLDFQTGRAFDVDGDGLVDMGLVPFQPSGSQYVENAYVTTRDIKGTIRPFARKSQAMTCLPHDLAYVGSVDANQKELVTDMDGDGLADVVVLTNTQPGPSEAFGLVIAQVYKNRGDGRFGLGRPASISNPCDNDALDPYDVRYFTNVNNGSGISAATFSSDGVTLHDVDGDGLADLVVVDGYGVHISPQRWIQNAGSLAPPTYGGGNALNFLFSPYVNNGDPHSCCPSPDECGGSVEFADVSASGVDGPVVFVCGGYNVALDFLNGTRPGLLKTISNGYGLTTTVTYDRLNDVMTPSVPVPVELVTQIQTTNGLSGNYQQNTTTTYTYQSPIFDARDSQFIGFQTVISSTPGDATGPGLDTVTRFATATCPGVAPGHPCALNGVSADYGWHMARGLPAVVEEHENDLTAAPMPGASGPAPGSGSILSETVNTYSYEQLYSGSDGRAVRQVYLSRNEQYFWDAGQPATVYPQPVLVDVGTAHAFDVQVPVAHPARGSAGHIIRTFHQNQLGNQDLRTDFGSAADQPLAVATQWVLPASDQTFWAYRPSSTRTAYVDSSGNFLNPVREIDFAYSDGSGLPTNVSSPLSGSFPLKAPPPGVASAPAPASASKDGTKVNVATIGHDEFGNVTSVVLANGQCTQIKYDPQFEQFPSETDQFVGGTCGSANPLATSQALDRGLEVVRTRLSISDGLTTTTYDAFGRPVDVFEPDPTASMTPNTVASEHFDYSHYDPPSAGPAPTYPAPMPSPWRVLLTQKNMGTQAAPQMAGVWAYSDSAGRALLTVRQDGSGGTSQIVEGAQLLGPSTGRVQQAWRPFAATLADGASFAVNTQTSSDTFQSYAYDALGRVTKFTDELQRTSTAQYLSSRLQELVADPIQSANHQYTLVQLNGRGQVTSSVRPHVDDPITTSFTYWATGEVRTIEKGDASVYGQRYARTMIYDTLGRLVANEEPNTTQTGALTSLTVGWTYAYNDSGQLVGIRDARGCGKNILYGPGGRMVGG